MFWCPLVVRAAAGSALFFVCAVSEALCWPNTPGRVVSASVGIREVRVGAGEAVGCNLGVNAAAAGPHVTIGFCFLAGVLRRLHRGESTRVLSQPLGLLPGMKKGAKTALFWGERSSRHSKPVAGRRETPRNAARGPSASALLWDFKTRSDEREVTRGGLCAGPALGPGAAGQDHAGADRAAPVPQEVPHDPLPALVRARPAPGRVRQGTPSPRARLRSLRGFGLVCHTLIRRREIPFARRFVQSCPLFLGEFRPSSPLPTKERVRNRISRERHKLQ